MRDPLNPFSRFNRNRSRSPILVVCGLCILLQAGHVSENDKTRVKMESMFLPGVENNPQPGPYADALRLMQAAGEYPQIWHMFAFKPRATDHLARFTQEIMREPAPLSPWLRELIAAFTSARNDCPF